MQLVERIRYRNFTTFIDITRIKSTRQHDDIELCNVRFDGQISEARCIYCKVYYYRRINYSYDL